MSRQIGETANAMAIPAGRIAGRPWGVVLFAVPFLLLLVEAARPGALLAAQESGADAANRYYDSFNAPEAAIRRLPVARTSRVPVPRALYHWTSTASLRDWARSVEARGSLSLKTIHNLFPVTKHFPEFQHASGREAIFAWDNPVGALTNDGGSERDLTDLALVRMRFRPDARARSVTTHLTGPAPDHVAASHRIEELEDIDLLRVDYRLGRRTVMQEWMILRTEAIAAFTADPEDVAGDLEPYLERMREGRPLEIDDLYQRIASPRARDHWINIHADTVVRSIERVLGARRRIPRPFRQRP
jgi:hypothetical protein